MGALLEFQCLADTVHWVQIPSIATEIVLR
jgi:hypothetical protein